ncbi:TIGR04222 domain-containing membrane protein [Streptomyces sp. NPDC001941]|uniref:TIGR04222 domain-containing membrane protein n=1 Tax=Streptomyces sp. NPDC001941 TaxID=3154659 RepID=UPI0033184498
MPVDTWWFVGAGAVLLAAAWALLRVAPAGDGARELTPQQAAFLRGGRRAAVTTAVTELYLLDAVIPARGGALRQERYPRGERDPLRLALYRELVRPLGMRPLMVRPKVRRAVRELRARLAGAGLLRAAGRWRVARTLLGSVPVVMVAGLVVVPLGAPNTPAQLAVSALPVLGAAGLWCVRRVTPAGRAALDALRERHPLPAARAEVAGGEEPLYVALHGDTALTLVTPHLARDGGLLGRGTKTDGYDTGASGSTGGTGYGGCGAAIP